jgi:Tol biopolymer transport system component
LWPAKVHVEFEGSLNAVIRDVREVLGDSAKNPRYIETEPRLGYRFIAPVRRLERFASEARPVARGGVRTLDAQPFSRRFGPRGVRLALVLGLPILLAVAVAVLWWLSSKTASASRTLAVSQYSFYVGKAGHPTFSPDGRQIAFHWNGDERGGFDIYQKGYGSEDLIRLTNNPSDDVYPSWSPDGRVIAFCRRLQGGHMAVMVVPAGGGAERLIGEISDESPLSWSADGKYLVYSVLFPNSVSGAAVASGIWAIALADGRRTRITFPEGNSVGDAYPSLSPDGHWLAFVRVFGSGMNDIAVVGVDRNLRPQGAPRRVTFDSQYARDPVWRPDSRSIVFASRRRGRISLWEVAFPGTANSQPVALGGEQAIEPVVDPTGSRILYCRFTPVDVLARLDLTGGPDAVPTKLLYSRKEARNPAYSPDGRRIVFESTSSGFVEVWVCDNDGSNQKQLTSLRSPVAGTPRWSPDGRWIAFDAKITEKSGIFVIPAGGGDPRRVTSSQIDSAVPSWSQDGRWIYFGAETAGVFQIWKLRASGGNPIQVTRHGGFHAIESRDGRTLYYAKGMQNTELWKVPARGGEERPVAGSMSLWANFATGRHGVYMVPVWMGRNIQLSLLPLAGGLPQKVAAFHAVDVQGLAVSPDQRELLMSVRKSDEADLMLLDSAR